MDFVVGNPPYVRVHNLENTFDMAKSFSFAQDGMTDLYIVFYEIGLKMLNENGVLGYITPSSYFNSIAGSHMRKVFVENNLIDQIVDLKHFQAFNATTYTEITILKKFVLKKLSNIFSSMRRTTFHTMLKHYSRTISILPVTFISQKRRT